MKKPRVAPTSRPKFQTPLCEPCAVTFLAAFQRVNLLRAPDKRRSGDEIVAEAQKRARAVKLAGEWICPRCTTVPGSEGAFLFLEQAYPNRQTRRAASVKKKHANAHHQKRRKKR